MARLNFWRLVRTVAAVALSLGLISVFPATARADPMELAGAYANVDKSGADIASFLESHFDYTVYSATLLAGLPRMERDEETRKVRQLAAVAPDFVIKASRAAAVTSSFSARDVSAQSGAHADFETYYCGVAKQYAQMRHLALLKNHLALLEAEEALLRDQLAQYQGSGAAGLDDLAYLFSPGFDLGQAMQDAFDRELDMARRAEALRQALAASEDEKARQKAAVEAFDSCQLTTIAFFNGGSVAGLMQVLTVAGDDRIVGFFDRAIEWFDIVDEVLLLHEQGAPLAAALDRASY